MRTRSRWLRSLAGLLVLAALVGLPRAQNRRGAADEDACQVDVACPAAEGWEPQTNAVLRIVVGGGRFCTGVLLNNTGLDATPYVLTAGHCGDLSQAVFWFDWKQPRCRGGKPAGDHKIRGSELVVTDAMLDFQLVQLPIPIPPRFGATFAGWDRRPEPPASVTLLHHPHGAPMKIAVDEQPPRRFGSRWKVPRWEIGATQGGSSGGPLFSPEGRVIGELVQGASTCALPENDQFLRLDAMWDLLAPVLDPTGSGVETLELYDPARTPPAPFEITDTTLPPVPALDPGTQQTVFIDGTGLRPTTLLELDGEPVERGRYSLFSHSRITLDLPQLAIGEHVLTVREGEAAVDLALTVVAAPHPVVQAGSGDPRLQVGRGEGIELLLAGPVGHELTVVWSTDPDELHGELEDLPVQARVRIPAEGWIATKLPIPEEHRRTRVHVAAFCAGCVEGPDPSRSAIASFEVL